MGMKIARFGCNVLCNSAVLGKQVHHIGSLLRLQVHSGKNDQKRNQVISWLEDIVRHQRSILDKLVNVYQEGLTWLFLCTVCFSRISSSTLQPAGGTLYLLPTGTGVERQNFFISSVQTTWHVVVYVNGRKSRSKWYHWNDFDVVAANQVAIALTEARTCRNRYVADFTANGGECTTICRRIYQPK